MLCGGSMKRETRSPKTPKPAAAKSRQVGSSQRRRCAWPHARLSDREFQLLQLIAGGQSVSGIAKTWSLSVKTVSTYRARLLEKMALKNNSELMHYAFQHRLVEVKAKESDSPSSAHPSGV
jgi:DNA-binding NarL/FixJ family response regulator